MPRDVYHPDNGKIYITIEVCILITEIFEWIVMTALIAILLEQRVLQCETWNAVLALFP